MSYSTLSSLCDLEKVPSLERGLLEDRVDKGGNQRGFMEGPVADAKEGREEAGDNEDGKEDNQGGSKARSGHADESIINGPDRDNQSGGVVSEGLKSKAQVPGGDHLDDPVEANFFNLSLGWLVFSFFINLS